jgi:hypothetical protein
MPRTVAKEVKPKHAVAWDGADVDRFLEATAEHRWSERMTNNREREG